MNPVHLERMLEAGSTLGTILVLACYALWSVALILIIVKCQREKAFGMPIVSSGAMLALCFICLVGPWVEPDLFYSSSQWYLWLTWLFWFGLALALYLQFLSFGRHWYEIDRKLRHPNDNSPRHDLAVATFYVVGISVPLIAGVLEWTFIAFVQDYYVNVTDQLVVLTMGAGYLAYAYMRPALRGLSPAAALMMTIGNAALALGIILGGMEAAFPNFAYGYAFLYCVFFFQITVFVLYTWVLHRRRAELVSGVAPNAVEEAIACVSGVFKAIDVDAISESDRAPATAASTPAVTTTPTRTADSNSTA